MGAEGVAELLVRLERVGDGSLGVVLSDVELARIAAAEASAAGLVGLARRLARA